MGDYRKEIEYFEGLYPKYKLINTNTGKEAEGEYFVLKPSSDFAARKALITYAEHTKDALLASDIRDWIEQLDSK